MVTHLPGYFVQTESEIYAPLPEFVSLSKDIQEVPPKENEEQLCLICMSELAVSHLNCIKCIEYSSFTLWSCLIHS